MIRIAEHQTSKIIDYRAGVVSHGVSWPNAWRQPASPHISKLSHLYRVTSDEKMLSVFLSIPQIEQLDVAQIYDDADCDLY